MVVALAGVTKEYVRGADAAVEALDLSIREGEFFSVLGPSGSGKTTTLRLIAGFETPTVGRVWLGGEDVTLLPPNHRDVNTVFQSYALFPHMTVHENVDYPLSAKHVPREERRARVVAALAQVEMTGFDTRLPHELSGGQRQRIALARALVGRPRVLLLDEPLGALDLKLRQSMQLVLKELQREVRITFVYVTHDQGEALAMSDRIAVMNTGRLEQVGSPREVYDLPETRFVATFIGDANLLQATGVDGLFQTKAGLTIRGRSADKDGSCWLSVRPEALQVGAAADGLENSFDATVAEAVFLGDEQRLFVEVGGERLTLKSPPSMPVVPGAVLRVGWTADAVIPLKD